MLQSATSTAREGLSIAVPKTDKSRRHVALSATAVQALRKHRAAQASQRLLLGAAWQDLDLVFTNDVGGPVEPTNLIRRFFQPLLKRAGLPPIRFHDLRHTAATLMLSQGVHPKIVSEMLGHSQINITLDLYSHVTPTLQRQAAAAVDDLLSLRQLRVPGLLYGSQVSDCPPLSPCVCGGCCQRCCQNLAVPQERGVREGNSILKSGGP